MRSSLLVPLLESIELIGELVVSVLEDCCTGIAGISGFAHFCGRDMHHD